MSDAKYLNRHQSEFLRKLRNHPHGLPIEDWPRASTWRRWLKRETFRRAMRSLRVAFQTQGDLMLSGSAARAALMMQALLSGGEEESGSGMRIATLSMHHEKLMSLSRVLREDLMHRAERRRLRQAAQQKSAPAESPDWSSMYNQPIPTRTPEMVAQYAAEERERKAAERERNAA